MHFQETALYQVHGGQLNDWFRDMIKETVRATIEQLNISECKPKEMCSRQVKRHLIEKGYKCNSTISFQKLVESHALQRVKRSNEYWYLTEEIEAIPTRLIKNNKSKMRS